MTTVIKDTVIADENYTKAKEKYVINCNYVSTLLNVALENRCKWFCKKYILQNHISYISYNDVHFGNGEIHVVFIIIFEKERIIKARDYM